MIVETKRLILREITVEDAEFVLRLVNEPSFVSNIGEKGLKNLHARNDSFWKAIGPTRSAQATECSWLS